MEIVCRRPGVAGKGIKWPLHVVMDKGVQWRLYSVE